MVECIADKTKTVRVKAIEAVTEMVMTNSSDLLVLVNDKVLPMVYSILYYMASHINNFNQDLADTIESLLCMVSKGHRS